MAECPACGGRVEESFRFCPWCATPQRVKLVEFFRGHALNEQERGKALRVSRYLGPKRHVRFSVWSEAGVAEAAVSLDESEVTRLRAFLGWAAPARRRGSRRAAARPGA